MSVGIRGRPLALAFREGIGITMSVGIRGRPLASAFRAGIGITMTVGIRGRPLASAFRESIGITMTVGISEAWASGKTSALGKALASWHQHSRHQGKNFT